MSAPTGDEAGGARPEQGWFGADDDRGTTQPRPAGGADDWIWLDGVRLPNMREVTAPTDGHSSAAAAGDSDGATGLPARPPGQEPSPRENAESSQETPTQPHGHRQGGASQPPVPERGTREEQQSRPRFLPGAQVLDRRGRPWSWSPHAQGRWPDAARPGGAHAVWGLSRSGGQRRPPSDSDQDVTYGENQLHWVSVPLRTLVITAVFLALPGVALISLGVQRVLAMTLMVFAAAGVYCLASWWLTWFRIDADHLMVRSGMLRRTIQEVPLSRLQAVDLVRPFVPQIFGLAELRIELAGGDRGEVRLRFLSAKIATRLRDVLLARAAGLPPLPDPPPERPFYTVPFGLLLAGLAFRLPVLGAFLLFLVLVVSGVAFRELGVLGGAVPLLLGLVRGFLGPLLRYASFTAALTPDGLRLRHGVFQRRVQTIPPGRVQAVRIVSPTLWRFLGVVRVEANVAGYVGERQMDSSTLLPVVDRATAYYLINQLFPGTSAETVTLRPAQRSISKRDALGVDQSMFVTRYGLVGEVLEMVPLARIQSVRMSSGLLARWFGVATVEVDCPPGPARMRATGRALSEARQVIETVTAGAHTARATTAGPERWATRADPD